MSHTPSENEPRWIGEPITDELPSRTITRIGDERYIIDFGQNLAGWVRVRLHGEQGDDVRIRHGEMLDANGELYRDNLKIFGISGAGAQQEDHAILSGTPHGDLFEPRFTYLGFRYVELAGLSTEPSHENIPACVVHSDTPRALEFECSNPMLNRLMTAIDWTLRDNLHSTPTDCPQRASGSVGWVMPGIRPNRLLSA